MPRVFDEHHFAQIAADARLLATQAASHEHDLVALVELLDGRRAAAPAAAGVAELADGAAGLASVPGLDLVARVRQLCVNARAHRQFAEGFIPTLTGDDAGGGVRRGSPRVLIVDDAEDIREILAIAFAAAGIEPITAADGLEALVAAHVARPAAILMDVNMPVLNGIEATRLLRAGAATRAVPVIAHTAKPDLLADPIARQFDLVVTKPAEPSRIVAAVQTCLDDRERTDAGAGRS